MAKPKFYNGEKFKDAERLNYLIQLKSEFELSKPLSVKQEILGNLTNFAYNPENYYHFYTLSLHELFLNNIQSSDMFISLASIKGICNLAIYEPFSLLFCQHETLSKILISLTYKNEKIEFVINCFLLLITLKRLKLGEQINVHKIIKKLSPKIKKDKQINNLCQILLNQC